MEQTHKHKKLITVLLIIGFAITIPIATVSAIHILTSNHKTGIVNTINLSIVANDTNVFQNDILLLTANLNSSKSGVSVQFFNGTTALNPTVLTDSSGNAQSYYNVTNSNFYDLYAKATIP